MAIERETRAQRKSVRTETRRQVILVRGDDDTMTEELAAQGAARFADLLRRLGE